MKTIQEKRDFAKKLRLHLLSVPGYKKWRERLSQIRQKMSTKQRQELRESLYSASRTRKQEHLIRSLGKISFALLEDKKLKAQLREQYLNFLKS